MDDPAMLLSYAIAFFSLFTVMFFLLLYIRHRNEYNLPSKRTSWRPKVTILIPAYNESKLIGNCLKSTLDLNYPKDKLEVIVIDDGSTDDTYKVAKQYENQGVKVLTKKNAGKGAALNFGLEKATGELTATMDADSYITKDALLELLPLLEDKDVGAVTPSIKIMKSNSIIKEMQRIEYLMILLSRKLLSYIDSVPVTPGPFSLFRTSVLREVGGFDPKNMVEDIEIALRIQSYHYKLKSSMTADVYTEPPETFGALLKQRVRWQRGGVRNYWKYRFLIKPEYGDFGMFFVPLNYLTIIAFFLLIGLMIYSFFSMPYYTKYIFVESIGMGIGLFTIVGSFVILSTALWVKLSVHSFKDEDVSLKNILLFMAIYWYLMLGYNLLMVYQELKREKTTW